MNSDKILNYVGLGAIIAGLLSVCFTPSTLAFTRLENFTIPIILLIFLASKKVRIELPYMLTLTAFFAFYIVSMFLNGDGM
ncbi:MAG: hypothetical protein JKY18_00395, partial [Flavobacteriales bacterium]|nr:hypothetical protein [Flavobacteriales bacterium]